MRRLEIDLRTESDMIVQMIVDVSGGVLEVTPATSWVVDITSLEGFADETTPDEPFHASPEISLADAACGYDVTGLAVVAYIGSAVLRVQAIVTGFRVLDDPPVTPLSSEEISRQRARSRIDETQHFQDSSQAPREGDDNPAGITVFQAYKLGAIIGAAHNGHHTYAAHLPDVAAFLNAAAVEATRHSPELPATSPAERLWDRLNALPWPRHGKPTAQPDIS